MIVYHAITTYHLLELWVHKLNRHPDEDAVLLLPDFIFDKYPNITEQIPVGVFSSVVVVPYRKVCGNTQEEIECKLDEVIGSLDLASVLLNAKEIYVAGAQYYLSLWLIKHEVPFVFVEEASGRLSYPEVVMDNVAEINPLQYSISIESGMFTGENPLVKHRIANVGAQKEGFDCSNVDDFNLVKELDRLSQEDRGAILKFFDCPECEFDKNSVVLLTQHFANLNMMSYEEQAVLYQMTVDYYLNNRKIFVKNHPDDLMPYKTLLESCEVIPGRFPSELLPLVSKNSAEMIAAISSTGVSTIRSQYDKCLLFGPEYERTFWDNHKYYFVARLVKLLEGYRVVYIGVNAIQLDNMLSFSDCSSECTEKGDGAPVLYVVGAINEEEAFELNERVNDSDVICYLNTDKQYSFYPTFEHSCFDSLIVKTIKLEAINKEACMDVAHEYVYISCKNQNIREGIASMKYEKLLINSGIETVVPANLDKDTQIAALKGMLEATEKRLLYYIELIKKSKEN